MVGEKSKGLHKLQKEEFCQLYVSKEFFGNGVETYLEVYDIDRSKPSWYKTACSAASRLLSNVKVAERINQLLNQVNQLLNQAGLNDANVDKQLLFLISQHADFTNKLGAIREYNKLKARIIEKVDHKLELPPVVYDIMGNLVNAQPSAGSEATNS